MDLFEELQYRNLIYQTTNEKLLRDKLNNDKITFYIGFDPTADSLHIGSLVSIILMKRLQNYGHQPIVLVGGATGLIGDPSGKNNERKLNAKEIVLEWSQKLKNQLSKFLDLKQTIIVNNYDWIKDLSTINFLRDVGKYFSVGYMIAKESVKNRIHTTGISFTEFSYMILQAYDYYFLNQQYNCQLQIGGSDQWGNITAGIDYIKKMTGKSVLGLTIPLLTKSDGTKFGKTEGGTIWLDPQKTSPYQFYQFFISTDDQDVIKLLKYYTFLPKEEIDKLEESTKNQPEQREAQKVLAREITQIVHGKEASQRAEKISKALFYSDISQLNEEEFKEAFQNIPSIQLPKNLNKLILEILVESGIASSKRQAREYITNNAISLNNQKINDLQTKLTQEYILWNKYTLIKKGKKNYYLIEWK